MRLKSRFSLSAFAVLTAAAPLASTALAQDDFGSETPVDSPLVRQPDTPQERVRAVLLLLKLNRPDLARAELRKLVAADVTDETLLELRRTYGPATFLSIARSADLQPEGSQLLDRISAAATTRRQAEGYLSGLLDNYGTSVESRVETVREIDRLAPDVVPALVRLSGQSPERDQTLVQILTRLEDRATRPLAVMLLESNVAEQRLTALRVLRRTAGPTEIAALAAIAGDGRTDVLEMRLAKEGLERLGVPAAAFDAADTLREEAENLLGGITPLPLDEDGAVIAFAAGEDGLIARVEVSEREARQLRASRLVRRAVTIKPGDRDAVTLLSVLELERDAAAATRLELLRRGPMAANETLELALELGLDRAAERALDLMARVGRIDSVSNGPYPALIRSLDAASPAVAFAAARAVVEMHPQRGFENGYRVVEILARQLESDDTAKVVVIDPNVRRGSDFGGRLSTLGLVPLVEASGREGFKVAASRGDVAMLAVNAASQQWELDQTIANLQADVRTKSIPVALYAETGVRERYEGPNARYDAVSFIPLYADAAAIERTLRAQLEEARDTQIISDATRRQEAATLLRKICERRMDGVFPLQPAVDTLIASTVDADEQVAADCSAALACVAYDGVQDSLVRVMNLDGRLPVRRAAAKALVENLRRFGRSLRGDAVETLKKLDGAGDGELTLLIAAAIGLAKG